MYEITSWDDVRRVAPMGAKFFRYRRPTGERRKFYEKGYAFPLDPESLADRKPAFTDGIYAVCFYTEEEALKEPGQASPMIIQPPDCDELQVEFPKGYKPGDTSEVLIIRELLNTNKDLARTAASAADASIKLLEKASHERDVMAAEADKNRIGPVWQLVLEHHSEIKDILIQLAPAAGALASNFAEKVSSASSVTTAFAMVKKDQEELQSKMERAVTSLAQICGKLQKDQKALRQMLAPKKTAQRRQRKRS